MRRNRYLAHGRMKRLSLPRQKPRTDSTWKLPKKAACIVHSLRLDIELSLLLVRFGARPVRCSQQTLKSGGRYILRRERLSSATSVPRKSLRGLQSSVHFCCSFVLSVLSLQGLDNIISSMGLTPLFFLPRPYLKFRLAMSQLSQSSCVCCVHACLRVFDVSIMLCVCEQAI